MILRWYVTHSVTISAADRLIDTPAEDLARRVHAHSVGDEDFDPIARPVLRLELAHAAFHVCLFIPARDGNGHERNWHDFGL